MVRKLSRFWINTLEYCLLLRAFDIEQRNLLHHYVVCEFTCVAGSDESKGTHTPSFGLKVFLWKDQQHRTGNNIFILLNTKTRVLPLCTAQRCVSAFPSHPSPRRQHTTCPPNILALKYQWAQRVKTIEYYRGPSPPTVGCHWTAPECHWTAPMPCLHKAKI